MIYAQLASNFVDADMSPQVSPSFSADRVANWVAHNYCVDVRSVKDLGSFEDQNYKIDSTSGQSYVFKISNANTHVDTLVLQNEVMAYLSQSISYLDFPEVIPSSNGDSIGYLFADTDARFPARLLSFVPGRLLNEFENPGYDLLRSIGASLAEIDVALRGYYHPGARRPNLVWDLQNALQIRSLLPMIKDLTQRRLAEYFFNKFDAEALPDMHRCRKSVVHNDAHRDSILVRIDKAECRVMAGLIDFGDTCYTATICNLAVAVYDAMLGREEPISFVLPLIEGYNESFPLREGEIDILYYLIAVRLSIYACMSARVCDSDPGNEHARRNQSSARNLMEILAAVSPAVVSKTFRNALQ